MNEMYFIKNINLYVTKPNFFNWVTNVAKNVLCLEDVVIHMKFSEWFAQRLVQGIVEGS